MMMLAILVMLNRNTDSVFCMKTDVLYILIKTTIYSELLSE